MMLKMSKYDQLRKRIKTSTFTEGKFMKDIIRIVVKGSSGYGPVDEAFKDKITVEQDRITYE